MVTDYIPYKKATISMPVAIKDSNFRVVIKAAFSNLVPSNFYQSNII